MGQFFSKFWKRESTFDILSNLENQIVLTEKFQNQLQQAQRERVFRFRFLVIVSSIILTVGLYIYFPQITQNETLSTFVVAFIIAVSILIWFISTFITYYYDMNFKKNENKLFELKKRKTEKLKQVSEIVDSSKLW